MTQLIRFMLKVPLVMTKGHCFITILLYLMNSMLTSQRLIYHKYAVL
jgi:hypothetical protein